MSRRFQLVFVFWKNEKKNRRCAIILRSTSHTQQFYCLYGNAWNCRVCNWKIIAHSRFFIHLFITRARAGTFALLFTKWWPGWHKIIEILTILQLSRNHRAFFSENVHITPVEISPLPRKFAQLSRSTSDVSNMTFSAPREIVDKKRNARGCPFLSSFSRDFYFRRRCLVSVERFLPFHVYNST